MHLCIVDGGQFARDMIGQMRKRTQPEKRNDFNAGASARDKRKALPRRLGEWRSGDKDSNLRISCG